MDRECTRPILTRKRNLRSFLIRTEARQKPRTPLARVVRHVPTGTEPRSDAAPSAL